MFKKITKILCVISTFTMISSVNAMTTNNKGNYITSKGIEITQDQYNYLKSKELRDNIIDTLPKEILNILLSKDSNTSQGEKYYATTIIKDNQGNEKNSYTVEISKADSKRLIKNPNLIVLENGKIANKILVANTMGFEEGKDQHSTYTKRVRLSYSCNNSGCTGWICNTWLNNYNPNVKAYDLIGIRFSENANISSLIAYQNYVGNSDGINYDLNNPNVMKFTNGIGLTMNLKDGHRPLDENLFVYTTNNMGIRIYGSYQHAKVSNISMAQSKSYTLSSSGLGGVFNHSYANKYDGMGGVYASRS